MYILFHSGRDQVVTPRQVILINLSGFPWRSVLLLLSRTSHNYNSISYIALILVCERVSSHMVHSLCTCQAGIITVGHDEERGKKSAPPLRRSSFPCMISECSLMLSLWPGLWIFVGNVDAHSWIPQKRVGGGANGRLVVPSRRVQFPIKPPGGANRSAPTCPFCRTDCLFLTLALQGYTRHPGVPHDLSVALGPFVLFLLWDVGENCNNRGFQPLLEYLTAHNNFKRVFLLHSCWSWK